MCDPAFNHGSLDSVQRTMVESKDPAATHLLSVDDNSLNTVVVWRCREDESLMADDQSS